MSSCQRDEDEHIFEQQTGYFDKCLTGNLQPEFPFGSQQPYSILSFHFFETRSSNKNMLNRGISDQSCTPWQEIASKRGYLQRQFLALTGNAALAVLGKAVLFGVGDRYKGIKMVIVIMVLGILYGILAHWRKSLRPGMIAHAWQDIASLIAI